MKANVNDRILLENTHVGDPRRIGIILEIHGSDGAPPYLIEWEDNGRRTLLFPGPDARLQPRTQVG